VRSAIHPPHLPTPRARRDVGAAIASLVVALLAPAASDAQVPGLAGTLVVTNKSAATATVLDVASGRALATLPTGDGPHEVVLTSDGRTAIVTNYGGRVAGSSLTVIDVPALRVARTIDLGEHTRPHGIVVLPGDSVVAVTSEDARRVVLVHVATGTVRRSIDTGHDGSHMVAAVADGTRLFTGDMGSNTVSELDARTGQRVRSFSVPTTPEAINVLPDGSEVWVGSNATGRVSVLNPRTGEVTTAAEGFGWPYRILFSPDAKLVFLPDLRGETLRFLDRASRRELGRIALAGAGPQGIIVTPDGRYLFQSLSREDRVAIVDVASRAVVGHLAAGRTPDGIAYSRNATVAPSR
jgi:DNA-binding beta-propeller fold protein YncE